MDDFQEFSRRVEALAAVANRSRIPDRIDGPRFVKNAKSSKRLAAINGIAFGHEVERAFTAFVDCVSQLPRYRDALHGIPTDPHRPVEFGGLIRRTAHEVTIELAQRNIAKLWQVIDFKSYSDYFNLAVGRERLHSRDGETRGLNEEELSEIAKGFGRMMIAPKTASGIADRIKDVIQVLSEMPAIDEDRLRAMIQGERACVLKNGQMTGAENSTVPPNGADEFDLDEDHFKVLRALYHQRSLLVNQKQLAEITGFDRRTAKKYLAKLIERRWACYSADPDLNGAKITDLGLSVYRRCTENPKS